MSLSSKVAATISILFIAISLHGQVAVNPTTTGVVPYGTYEGSGIDHVDLSNGEVYLRIPLYAVPQLGSLHVSFSLRSSGASRYLATGSCANAGTECNYQYSSANTVNPTVGYDQLLTIAQPEDPSVGLYLLLGCTPGYSCQQYTDPVYTYIHKAIDAFGNMHYLGYDASTNYTTLRSFDGSGLLEVLTDPNGYKDGATGTLYDSIGIRYDSTGITDPNGNHIAFTSTGLVDSLGRTIPNFPDSRSGASTQGCPNLNNSTQPVTGAVEWDLPGPTDYPGGMLKYLICYTTFYYHTDLLLRNGSSILLGSGPTFKEYNEASGEMSPIQSIVYPDGRALSFEYDGSQNPSTIAWGDLMKVHLPDGGLITYTYSTLSTCIVSQQGYPLGSISPSFEPYSRAVTSRTLRNIDGSTDEWTYSYGNNPAAGGTTTLVTDPNGNQSEYHFTGLESTNTCSYAEDSEKDYQGSAASGTLKRSVLKTYDIFQVPQSIVIENGSQVGPQEIPFLRTITTTLDQGPSVTTAYSYDNGFTNAQPTCSLSGTTGSVNVSSCQWDMTGRSYAAVLGFVTSATTSGTNGSGGTLSTTRTTSYKAFNATGVTNSGYYGANLLDFPLTVSVVGSGGNSSVTTYGYDESNGSPIGLHGNMTSTTVTGPNGGAEETSTVYNGRGMPASKVDANGNQTVFTYGDPASASPTKIALPATANGVSHVEQYTWDPSTGSIKSFTDQDGIDTKYTYNDPLGRISLIDRATGTAAESTATYSYSTPNTVRIELDEKARGDNLIQSSTVVDGFGRVSHVLGPGGATVDTTYDPLGRIHCVSNSYFSTADSTYGQTCYTYDAIGRRISLAHQDKNQNTISQETWSYDGNITTYTDENGSQWQRTYDALGQLTQVLEPNGSSMAPSVETDYSYDALGNLLRVDQWGGASGASGDRVRSFTYDSLSRLITSANPETGTICYGVWSSGSCIDGYDGNGNVVAKADARGVTTKYSYDALNRLLSKTYANDASGTPVSCYQYDTSSVSGAGGNLIGRLTNAWTQKAGTSCSSSPQTGGYITLKSELAYDAMGRLLTEQQCTPGNCTTSTPYTMNYTYDLAGDLYTSSNGLPSTPGVSGAPLTFTYAWNGAQWLQGVTSNWSTNNTAYPSQLMSVQSYYPMGAPAAMTYGNGLTINRTYDNRLRITGETDTGGVRVNATPGTATITITGAEQN